MVSLIAVYNIISILKLTQQRFKISTNNSVCGELFSSRQLHKANNTVQHKGRVKKNRIIVHLLCSL